MIELHLELLLGRTVVDANGRRVGRIQEFVAEQRGDGLEVTEVHVGLSGLEERLSVGGAGVTFTKLFGGLASSATPQRIPWKDLDFADPDHPKLRSSSDERSTS